MISCSRSGLPLCPVPSRGGGREAGAGGSRHCGHEQPPQASGPLRGQARGQQGPQPRQDTSRPQCKHFYCSL